VEATPAPGGLLWDSSGSAAVLMLLAIGRQEIIRVNASKTREMQRLA